jgi:hypothetical protein
MQTQELARCLLREGRESRLNAKAKRENPPFFGERMYAGKGESMGKVTDGRMGNGG